MDLEKENEYLKIDTTYRQRGCFVIGGIFCGVCKIHNHADRALTGMKYRYFTSKYLPNIVILEQNPRITS